MLDRFRAPGCAFVVPPLAQTPTLAADERIDIGHETLLRRWRKLAGDQTADPRTGRPQTGWLVAEQNDGQRYRTLLSLLGDTPDDEKAVLKDPVGTKRWWDSLPRTSAWGERYGGRFSPVKELIEDNLEARTRSRRNRILIVAGCALAVVGFAGTLVKIQIDRARQQQEAIERGAMESAATMLNKVLNAYRNGTLNLDGAKSLASVSEDFLRELRRTQTTSAADTLWIDALNLESDLQANAQANTRQLALAEEAKNTAGPLAAASPNDRTLKLKLYESLIRFGTALAMFPNEHGRLDQALQAYQDAMKAAIDIAAHNATDLTLGSVGDTHLKIGDVHQLQRDDDRALAEYREGLAICNLAVTKFPTSADALRYRANAHARVADALRQTKAYDAAEAEYALAERDQLAIITRDPTNTTVQSNLASTYNHWGLLAGAEGNLELALSKLKQGIALQKILMQSDPSNPQWVVFAAPNYEAVVKILDELKRPNEAYRYLQKAFDLRKDLTIRDANSASRQMTFAAIAKTLGDRSAGVSQLDIYRDAIHAWRRVLDLPTLPSALKDQTENVLAMAQVFATAKDWRDAQSAYWLAKRLADLNLTLDPASVAWREKSDSALKSAQAAADQALAAAPEDAAN